MTSTGSVLGGVSATLAFLLELAVYAAAAYWGWTRSPGRRALQLVAAVAAVAGFALVWALFGAPTAVEPLHGPARFALELVWFGSGAAALYAAGRRNLALWFVAAWAVSEVLQLAAK